MDAGERRYDVANVPSDQARWSRADDGNRTRVFGLEGCFGPNLRPSASASSQPGAFLAQTAAGHDVTTNLPINRCPNDARWTTVPGLSCLLTTTSLPAFVGSFESGQCDLSQQVDALLADGFGR